MKTIELKQMELSTELITSTEPIKLCLKISKNNASTYSECSDSDTRRFIFLLEETDEETEPLAPGEEYLFK
jgi:hypothetical protein